MVQITFLYPGNISVNKTFNKPCSQWSLHSNVGKQPINANIQMSMIFQTVVGDVEKNKVTIALSVSHPTPTNVVIA